MSPNRPSQAAKAPAYTPPAPAQIKRVSVGDLLPDHRSLSMDGQRQLLFATPDGRQPDLWCAGHIRLLQRTCVAIVGTREVTNEGASRARRLAGELAKHGVVVVSGLARGVDTEALTSAISMGGSVVAVIGTPIDRAYPAENAALQERIAKEHLLVSQFEPGMRTFPSHFPQRNRLMAAVSDATVIIEAGDTSGTLHQAAECVRLGRWLFVARSVMEDKSLEWPSKFQGYSNVRTLVNTSDVLTTLRIA